MTPTEILILVLSLGILGAVLDAAHQRALRHVAEAERDAARRQAAYWQGEIDRIVQDAPAAERSRTWRAN